MKFKSFLFAACSFVALSAAMSDARAMQTTTTFDDASAVYFVAIEDPSGPAYLQADVATARAEVMKPRETRAGPSRKPVVLKLAEEAPQATGAGSDNPTQSLTPQAAQPDNQVTTLRARAQLGLGQIGPARRSAEEVLARDPNNLEALRVLAQVEESAGRWRQAAVAWGRVYDVSHDAAAARRRDELIRGNGSSVTVAGFFEGAVGADEQYGARATANYRPLNGPEWAVMLENRHAEDDVAIALNGTIGSISLDRQRLEVAVGDTFTWGRANARAILTNDVQGARLGIGKSWGTGSVDLTVGWNEAYWLFSEGIANEATTDYVALSGTYRFPRVSLRGAVRTSTYGVADDDKIASSVRYTAGVEVALSDGANPFIVSYIVDGEDYSDIDIRQRVNLTTYQAMPFVDREVHSLGLYKTIGDTAHSFANIGAGYRADRFGAEGPFASVWGEHELTENTNIGARIEYSKPSIRGAQDDNSYGFAEIYLRRRF